MAVYFANQTSPLKHAAQGMSRWTCCSLFNEVLYSEVHIPSCHPILLLTDNAYFSRGECCAAFFTPNVTSRKQSCDLGVIAAVKKV